MLGIGFLALIGVGLALSAGGGGDDVDPEVMDEPEDGREDEDITVEPIDIPTEPSTDGDDEIAERIRAFQEELRNEPGLSDEEAQQRLNDFIEALAAEGEAAAPLPETPAQEPPVTPEPEEEPRTVIRPPTGDQYNDPTDTPREAFVPTAPQTPDTPATPVQPSVPAASAEELVTVTTNTGSEFADSAVLRDGPASGENADRDYIVRTSTVANDIEVGYDSQVTFLIEYSNQTSTVNASLNSDIKGPDGLVNTSTSVQTDDNGTRFTLNSSNLSFRGSADITLNIDETQIGTHVSQIDLTNPRDSLNFNFASNVTGNLHLVYNDAEVETGDDTSTTRTLYVIETAANVNSLSAADIARILREDGSATQGTRLVAEIHLGTDSLTIDGDPASRQQYEVTMTDFINGNPNIASNVAWTSVGEHDGTTPSGAGLGGTGFNVPSFPILGNLPIL